MMHLQSIGGLDMIENKLSKYRELLFRIEDDIEEELISIFTCPYCGYVVIDDSSNFSPTQFNIGDKDTMNEHIIEQHLEDLKDDYGDGDNE